MPRQSAAYYREYRAKRAAIKAAAAGANPLAPAAISHPAINPTAGTANPPTLAPALIDDLDIFADAPAAPQPDAPTAPASRAPAVQQHSSKVETLEPAARGKIEACKAERIEAPEAVEGILEGAKVEVIGGEGAKVGAGSDCGKVAEADCTVIAPRGAGMGSAATKRSPAVPVRERSKDGTFPARTKICPPCSPVQYVDALALMRQGFIVAEVVRGSGAECWDAIKEHALEHYPQDWTEIERAYKAARIDRLADRAQAVAEQREPCMRQSTKDADGGYTTIRQRRTDSGMVSAALAAIDPANHGRAAGRQPGAVVNIALLDPGHAQTLRTDADTPRPVRR